ncbi:CDP-glycerol--glycerophosphate glycerophosphotransferase, partial [Geobacillus sp. MMMUD3]|nr:CDP-glycerol--glycerophosphate glycerophosphotransferase [Geobacillus sp. MMMUD3]
IHDHSLQNQILMQGDILAMFDTVDLLVTDISSVGLDFLYMHPEKPLVLTDRRDDPEQLHDDAPISRATPVIDGRTVQDAQDILAQAMNHDETAAARRDLRTFYFGEGARGTSTRLFTAAVSELIAQRSADLAGFRDAGSNAESSE